MATTYFNDPTIVYWTNNHQKQKPAFASNPSYNLRPHLLISAFRSGLPISTASYSPTSDPSANGDSFGNCDSPHSSFSTGGYYSPSTTALTRRDDDDQSQTYEDNYCLTETVSDTSSSHGRFHHLSSSEDEDDRSSSSYTSATPSAPSTPILTTVASVARSFDDDEDREEIGIEAELNAKIFLRERDARTMGMDCIPSEVLQLIYGFLLSKAMPLTCRRFHYACRAYHLPLVLPPPCEVKLQARLANLHQLPGCVTLRVCAGAAETAEPILHAAVPRHLDGLYVDCTHRTLTDNDVSDMCNVFSSMTCEVNELTLDMNGHQFTLDGCRNLRSLYNFAAGTDSLQTLQVDLSCNSITSFATENRDSDDSSNDQLATGQRRFSISDMLTDTLDAAARVKINLEWNSIQSIPRLHVSARTMERLTCLHLNVARNQLTRHSIDNITTALRQCTALSTLHLTVFDNRLGVKGAANLAPIFAIASLLELHLDVDRCGLGSEGAGILLAAASTASGLRTLSLSMRHNGITRSLNFHAFGQLTVIGNGNVGAASAKASVANGITTTGTKQTANGSTTTTATTTTTTTPHNYQQQGYRSRGKVHRPKPQPLLWNGGQHAPRRMYIDLYGNNIAAGCSDLMGSFNGATHAFSELEVNLRANSMDDKTHMEMSRAAAKLPHHMQFSF